MYSGHVWKATRKTAQDETRINDAWGLSDRQWHSAIGTVTQVVITFKAAQRENHYSRLMVILVVLDVGRPEKISAQDRHEQIPKRSHDEASNSAGLDG